MKRVCEVCGASDWGTRNRCNPCRARKAREAWAADPLAARAKDRKRVDAWRAANPTKRQAQNRRYLYRLDEATFARLLEEQDHRCAICCAAPAVCVDHCHRTGEVRGILCRPCNVALGQFYDDVALLAAAITYLEETAPHGR